MKRIKISRDGAPRRLPVQPCVVGTPAETPAIVKMGSPRKLKPVTFNSDEFQILLQRLGYKNQQDLMDDLAMGLIHPVAPPATSPNAMPEVESSRKLAEVAKPKLTEDLSKYVRLSWADEAEANEVDLMDVVPIPWTIVVESSSGQAVVNPVVPDGGEVLENEASIEKAVKNQVIPPVNPNKSWSDIVEGNRSVGTVLKLNFVPTADVSKISPENWDEGAKLWSYALL